MFHSGAGCTKGKVIRGEVYQGVWLGCDALLILMRLCRDFDIQFPTPRVVNTAR